MTALLLAALWVFLAGADPASWLVGIPTIAVALTSVWLLPRSRNLQVRPVAVARLLGALLRDSVRGALLIGARSVARDPDLRPRWALWPTSLRTPLARLTLVHAISLVPGTLSGRIDDDGVLVHIIGSSDDWHAELAALEARVAAAFEPPQAGS